MEPWPTTSKGLILSTLSVIFFFYLAPSFIVCSPLPLNVLQNQCWRPSQQHPKCLDISNQNKLILAPHASIISLFWTAISCTNHLPSFLLEDSLKISDMLSHSVDPSQAYISLSRSCICRTKRPRQDCPLDTLVTMKWNSGFWPSCSVRLRNTSLLVNVQVMTKISNYS